VARAFVWKVLIEQLSNRRDDDDVLVAQWPFVDSE
jgi:hypothetical protein